MSEVCIRVCVRGRAKWGGDKAKEREFAADAHVLFMRAQRICGIKALSNIKQKRGRQSKEEQGEKSSEAESMTSLGFSLFYLSASIFYPLFCFHSEAVRRKTAM